MIVEEFDMQIWRKGACVYDGRTTFGFFEGEALARQVGIRDAGARRYVPDDSELARSRQIALPDLAPRAPGDVAGAIPHGASMPARALRMIDEITCYVADGGPHGLGYVRGVKRVDPAEWFFAAHFYQDPVCPGSLGLESFLQLLKAVALDRWGDRYGRTHRFAPIGLGVPHTWAYRGQIIPANREVTVEAAVTRVIEGDAPTLCASGLLSVDGVAIYEMTDFAISLVPL
jgi:3-hydroxymyristoyl/3-hydroxydecanoyl-(acyl carrier protein) dehydratase